MSGSQSRQHGVSPNVLQQFAGIQRLFQQRYSTKLSRETILEGVSATFGIEGLDDVQRHRMAELTLDRIAGTPPSIRSQLLEEIIDDLLHVTWHSCGPHRYMPLALAVVNHFRGRDVLAPDAILALLDSDPSFKYLQNNYLLFANPFGVEPSWQGPPPSFPSWHRPTKKTIRWLDVGAAPKARGAPSLNVLRQALKTALPDYEFQILGTDILFPRYEIVDGELQPSVFHPRRWIDQDVIEVGGIRYLNARAGHNDVMSQRFQLGSFDFVSLCMTFHHLRGPSEACSLRPLADGVCWCDENGVAVDDEMLYEISPTQQAVMKRLLYSLDETDGGVLFLNLKEGVVRDGGMISGRKCNDGLFLIVQRLARDEFRCFSNAIPFRPEIDPYDSVPFLFHPAAAPLYQSIGIQGLYPSLSESLRSAVKAWLRRADMLVYRNQRKDLSAWWELQKACQAICRGEQLTAIFGSYLGGLPDQDKTKKRLLQGVERLQRQILSH